jgi:ATP-dependent DNA helicase RecQ
MDTMASARQRLEEVFGFDSFRPGQEEVIGHLLAGRSAAAVFPTGGGKSLCYQLPALLLPGLTLVVSPLIALMKDQIDQLRSRGVAANRLDSSLTVEEYRQVMAGIRGGSLKLLYVAPERFNNERFRETVQRTPISLMAIDEAHCISEWGHNFRPDYLKLAELGRRYRVERVLALTATAPPQVLDDICEGFDITPECAVRTGFYRPNLTLLFTPVAKAERDQVLVSRFQERQPGPAIVYVSLQRTSEEVAARLHSAGFEARAYHAGMKTEERTAVQDWFLGSDRAIVVATIAFGMGIDKPDIRSVYHYNLAKSLENLSQEIGRAGRDGLPSSCESLVCPDDLNVLRNFAYGDTPSHRAVAGLLHYLTSQPDRFDVSLYDLSSSFDIRQLVVRTLLTYLELEGFLEAGTPWYSSYRFKPLHSSAEILANFNERRQRFLTALFKQAEKAKTWFTIDLDAAAEAIGEPRERLVRALDYLAEQGHMELQTAGVRNTFTWLQRPSDLDSLARLLHQRTIGHEQREISRLDQVLELAGHDGCQTAKLCTHFGEPRLQPCGHCCHCHNGKATQLLPVPQAAIPESTWQRAEEVRREHADALAEPRAFARFVTGLSSPGLVKKRLTRDPLFGCLAHIPFPEILQRARETA